jgi:hypothetical protein
MNNQTVNAEVPFLSDETWKQLSGISTIRATFGAVTKSTLVKSILLREINFAFVCVATYSVYSSVLCLQLHTLLAAPYPVCSSIICLQLHTLFEAPCSVCISILCLQLHALFASPYSVCSSILCSLMIASTQTLLKN